MDRMMTVSDIQARYSCSPPTARKLMRQMPHMDINGLKVWLRDVEDWEDKKLVTPGRKKPRPRIRTDGGLIPYRK